MHEPRSTPGQPDDRRRPIRLRSAGWVRVAAAFLARRGVQPNQISVLSVVCAAAGAGALVGSGQTHHAGARAGLLLLAGGGVQLRLLCNLLDGLVAVEGGLGTRTGELYNELPDRLSDALLLAAAGCATNWTGWEHDLGWAAAVLAVCVAYVRALGGQLGVSQQFCGPMAKQQRMFTLTLACAATAAEVLSGRTPRTMTWALGIIVVGAAFTMGRRAVRIARALREKSPDTASPVG